MKIAAEKPFGFGEKESVPPKKCVLVTVLDRFLQSLRARNFSEATVNTRRDGLKKLLAYLEDASLGDGSEKESAINFQDITVDTLLDFAEELKDEGLSENTIDAYLRTARIFLNWLEERGELFENPARQFRMPKKSRKLLSVPSEGNVRRLLTDPDTDTPVDLRDRAMLEALYGLGVRLGELCRLDLADLDFEAHTARIKGKGGRERVLPMGLACAQPVRDYLSYGRPKLPAGEEPEQQALWLKSQGCGRMSTQSVEKMLQNRSREAGIERITPHGLRRAMATHMLRNGAHPVHIQFLLGHRSMRHMSQYLQLTITDIKKMHETSNPGQ